MLARGCLCGAARPFRSALVALCFGGLRASSWVLLVYTYLEARGDRRLQTLRDNVPLQMQAKWFMEADREGSGRGPGVLRRCGARVC